MRHIVICLLAGMLMFSQQKAMAGNCSSTHVKIATTDKTSCIPQRVCNALEKIGQRFGTVSIVSAYRSKKDNARRGGAKDSLHIQCRAIDFLIPNHGSRNTQQELANFMEKMPFRYNVYCTGRAHIDDSNRKNGYNSCVKSGRGNQPESQTDEQNDHAQDNGLEDLE